MILYIRPSASHTPIPIHPDYASKLLPSPSYSVKELRAQASMGRLTQEFVEDQLLALFEGGFIGLNQYQRSLQELSKHVERLKTLLE